MKNMINTIGYFGQRRIEWISESQIKPLKELGCNRNNYNSYQMKKEKWIVSNREKKSLSIIFNKKYCICGKKL